MDEMDASQYYNQSTIHNIIYSDINIVQLSLILTVKIITHIDIHTNAKNKVK